MKTGVLVAIGWVLVFSSTSHAQQMDTPPAPGSLSVPRPSMAPPPPASLRVPQPLTRTLPVPSRGGPPGPGFQQPVLLPGGFVYPNLWYGAFFPYVPKHHRRHKDAFFPYVPQPYSRPKPMVLLPGSLQLNTAPGTAQVYVDGFYVGIVDDFGVSGRRLNLEPGSHRILLRASGYYDLAFDVYIEPGRTIVYRGDLEPLRVEPPPPRVAPSAPAAPGTPSTPRMFYVIPNCYAGDIPPAGALPKGCNIRDMRARRLN